MYIPSASEMRNKVNDYKNDFTLVKAIADIDASATIGHVSYETTELSENAKKSLEAQGYKVTVRNPTKECCTIYKISW